MNQLFDFDLKSYSSHTFTSIEFINVNSFLYNHEMMFGFINYQLRNMIFMFRKFNQKILRIQNKSLPL